MYNSAYKIIIGLSLLFSFCHSQSNNTTETFKKTKAATICGINGNTETICSPSSGDIWQNGTWYPITWNSMYPTYVSSSTLDIYIYLVENYQSILIKKITEVNTKKGTYPVLVDDHWRLNPTQETYESLIYIVPTGVNPEKEISNRFSDLPPPVHYFVEQPLLTPISTSLPTTTTATTLSTSLKSSSSASIPTGSSSLVKPTHVEIAPLIENDSKIEGWIIAVVILSCLAVLGACVAIVWVVRHSRNRQLVYGEKGHLELSSIKLPLADSMYLMNDPSSSNISNRSEPPLTSTDALLIADTFRQRMRRPDWQKHEKPSSDQLLKSELEAEGTLMQKVGKKINLSNT